MSDTPEHFSANFTIARSGAKTVEQDTPEDVAACVYRIALCPEGYREDLPEFGVPELAFQTVPLDLATYDDALKFWEPRATLESIEEAQALSEQQVRKVAVEVGTE